MAPSWERLARRERRSVADVRDARARRGFSLIDLLVSMAVVLVLIGLLLPSLRSMREYANRVVCSSNVRQVGLGLALYARDYEDAIPPSVFMPQGSGQNRAESETIHLRQHNTNPFDTEFWDGLGFLYYYDYLNAELVFYCPSHSGNHPFERYADAWTSDIDEIAGNYQYRGEGPNGNRYLTEIDPSAALVTDLLTSIEDYSHEIGSNVLRADISVFWFADTSGELEAQLAAGGGGNDGVQNAWTILDGPPDDDGTSPAK